MEASLQFRSYSNYVQSMLALIKAALRHMRLISLTEPFLLCVVIITAFMELPDKMFPVRHSPYAMSKFELSRPSEHRENGWKHFLDE